MGRRAIGIRRPAGADRHVALTIEPPDRRTALIRLRLALYFVALFVVLGAWLPYWPLWLKQHGRTEAEISLLIAASIWARVAATPLVAAHADRSGRRKRTMVLFSAIAMLGFLPFGWVDGFVPMLGLCVLFGIAYPPLIPLVDGLTVAQGRCTPGLRYGRIRLWGSAAFLVTAIGLGRSLDGARADIVYLVIVAALITTVGASLWLPNPDHGVVTTSAAGTRQPHPIRTLFAQPGFVVVLITTGLIQGSHAAYYAFSTLHWKAAGIDATTIGLLWAEGVVAEILLFGLGAGWVERFGARRLFVLGAGAAIVRWLVLATSTDPSVLAATNWLHALSFGGTHLATIGYVTRVIPGALLSTAQSMLSAISTGAATALATMLAGALYDRTPSIAFASMAALAIGGGICGAKLNPEPAVR